MLHVAVYFLLLLSGSSFVLSQPTKVLTHRQYSPDDISIGSDQDEIKLASSNIDSDSPSPPTAEPNNDDLLEAFNGVDLPSIASVPPRLIASCRKARQQTRQLQDPQQGLIIFCNGGRGAGDCEVCQRGNTRSCIGIQAPVCGQSGATEQCMLIWASGRIDLTVEQTAYLLPPVCIPSQPPQ